LSIETALLTAGIVAEALVVALLWGRRVYRQLPSQRVSRVGLLSDCSMPLLQSHFAAGAYIRIYLAESSLDSLLQYGVLVELAWAVLRPFHAMSPRRVLQSLRWACCWRAPWRGPSRRRLECEKPMGLCADCAAGGDIRDLADRLLSGARGYEPLLAVGWRNRELQVRLGWVSTPW